MSLTLVASKRFDVHPAVIFKAAFEFNEVRLHPQNMREAYEDCVLSDSFPVIVEDFALSILAGQIRIVKKK
jgi:hypothetical protein